jgi:hypothetical protein
MEQLDEVVAEMTDYAKEKENNNARRRRKK